RRQHPAARRRLPVRAVARSCPRSRSSAWIGPCGYIAWNITRCVRPPNSCGQIFATHLDESVTQGVAAVIHTLVRKPSTGGVENLVPRRSRGGEIFTTPLDTLLPQARPWLIHTLLPSLSTPGVENRAARGTSLKRATSSRTACARRGMA